MEKTFEERGGPEGTHEIFRNRGNPKEKRPREMLATFRVSPDTSSRPVCLTGPKVLD